MRRAPKEALLVACVGAGWGHFATSITGVPAPAQRVGQHAADVRYRPQPARLQWCATLGGATLGRPALFGKWAYVTAESDPPGQLFLAAISPAGSVRWKHELGSRTVDALNAPIVARDGTVYVGSTERFFYALNLEGGVKWQFAPEEAASAIWGTPVQTAIGTLYVNCSTFRLPDGSGCRSSLFALSRQGKLLWKYALAPSSEAALDGQPAVGPDGTVYVSARIDSRPIRSVLLAIDPRGKLRWRRRLGDRVRYGSPAVGRDGTIYLAGVGGRLYAIRPNGEPRWEFRFPSGTVGTPALAADGTLYLGAYDNTVYAVRPNGRLRWKYRLQGEITHSIYSSAAVDARGTIYIGTNRTRGNLVALNADGTLRWRYPAHPSPSDANTAGHPAPGYELWGSPELARDGTVYVATTHPGQLYTFR